MSLREKLEQYTIILVAILATIFSLLETFRLYEKISWLSWAKGLTPSSIVVLLAFIAIFLVLERRGRLNSIFRQLLTVSEQLASQENHLLQVSAFFNALRDGDHFAEILLLYSVRSYGKLVSNNSVSVDREHSLEFWRDCIGGCKSWLVVTYARLDETWDQGWGDTVSQGIQQERILAGTIIKRVFVVEDEEERCQTQKFMQNQQAMGIDTKWIFKDGLLKNQFVAKYVKDLGTIDVAVVDGTWVHRAFFDKNRRLISGSATRDPNLTEKALFVFNEAYARGKLHDVQP